MQFTGLKEWDIRGFSKLAKRIILESPHYSDFAKRNCVKDFRPEKIKADLKDRTVLLIAAKDGGKIVGFIRGFFDGGVASGIFWLQWIGVDAAYRGSGLADKMLGYLANKLRDSYGAHKIVCVVRPRNRASIALFRRNKYRRLMLLKKHWYGVDFLLLYRRI